MGALSLDDVTGVAELLGGGSSPLTLELLPGLDPPSSLSVLPPPRSCPTPPGRAGLSDWCRSGAQRRCSGSWRKHGGRWSLRRQGRCAFFVTPPRAHAQAST